MTRAATFTEFCKLLHEVKKTKQFCFNRQNFHFSHLVYLESGKISGLFKHHEMAMSISNLRGVRFILFLISFTGINVSFKPYGKQN